jgi:hypothetical protein
MYAVGRADNARNMGQFYFYYAGDGSTSNRLSLGMHSVDDVINIMGSGLVGISTTSTYADASDKFVINGGRLSVVGGNHSAAVFNRSTNGVITDYLVGGFGRGGTTFDGTNFGIFSNTGLRLLANGSNVMFVTGSGRVGINTTAPISTFDIQGTVGQLFSVTDSLTGTIMSVNDISGVPILEVTAASTNVVTVTGEIRATSEITAYYSDERLKTKVGTFEDPLKIVQSLHGFKYINNDRAKDFGYCEEKVQVGLSAQEVQRVLPEVVTLAPFDTIKNEDGTLVSRTGENYLTLDYAKLVPILIEAIKKQQEQIDELKQLLTEK